MIKIIFNKPYEHVIDHNDVNTLDTVVVAIAEKSLIFTVSNVDAKINTDVLGVIMHSVNIEDKPFKKGYVFIPINGKEIPSVLESDSYEYREEFFTLLNKIPNIEFYVIPGK